MLYKWTYLQNSNWFTDVEKGLVVAKGDGGGEREGLGVWDPCSRWTIIYRMDKPQGPIVWYREVIQYLW